MGEAFTPGERALLKPYVSNLDKPVFVLQNLPEVVKGALFSRYSRSDKSLRRMLLDEFINAPESGFTGIVGAASEDSIVAVKKAEDFYDRVLVGYGDDSVGELGGASIACEEVSQLTAKVLEDSRLGISPLEKSTRYIFFNSKPDGKYRYYRGPELMNSPFAQTYIDTMELLFGTYSKHVEPMMELLARKNPKPSDVTDRAYKSTLRAKAADVLRVFLPASTLTNVGLFGNGRALEYLMTKMYAHDLPEMPSVAREMQSELMKSIPSFVKRASPEDKYGGETNRYMKNASQGLRTEMKPIVGTDAPRPQEEIMLTDCDEEAEEKVLSALMYSDSTLSLKQLKEKVQGMAIEKRKSLLDSYLGKRENRRHKAPRAFENAYYTFDILGNYGIYRDLQRHRVLTQERQDLTVLHGYDTPKEFKELGMEEEYHEVMRKAAEAYWLAFKQAPKLAQYVVPFGYRIRWYMTMNLREVYHMTELRTSRQGHPDYRRICQKMHKLVKEKHPLLSEYMRFVDLNDYELERLEAEKRIDKKMDALKTKGTEGM